MSFYLISDDDRRTFTIGAADRDTFRDNALEIRMYYVSEGETILVTRGQEALLMEGGSGGAFRHPALAQAIAGELQGRQVRAIVASHPHRDHTNSHSDLVGAVNFAQGALYFDNGIPAADRNFQSISNDHQALPFQRVAVFPNQQDATQPDRPEVWWGRRGCPRTPVLDQLTNSLWPGLLVSVGVPAPPQRLDAFYG